MQQGLKVLQDRKELTEPQVLMEQMELQVRKAQQVQLALRVLMEQMELQVRKELLAHKDHKELQAHKDRQVLRELQELQVLLVLRGQRLTPLTLYRGLPLLLQGRLVAFWNISKRLVRRTPDLPLTLLGITVFGWVTVIHTTTTATRLQ